MPIWDIFKKNEEPVQKKVDPIVEQRRKEKFSTPLIYNEGVEKGKELEQNFTNSQTLKTTPQKPITSNVKKVEKTNSYVMSEVISPFYGKKEEKSTSTHNMTPQKKKQVRSKSIEDQLVPVISPIFGAYVEERKDDTSEDIRKTNTTSNVKDTASFDLDDILKQENNNLKVVEKRTGEIQLDLLTSNTNDSKEELSDAMTLDELMSLYERKFKDGENE